MVAGNGKRFEVAADEVIVRVLLKVLCQLDAGGGTETAGGASMVGHDVFVALKGQSEAFDRVGEFDGVGVWGEECEQDGGVGDGLAVVGDGSVGGDLVEGFEGGGERESVAGVGGGVDGVVLDRRAVA